MKHFKLTVNAIFSLLIFEKFTHVMHSVQSFIRLPTYDEVTKNASNQHMYMFL